MLMQDYIMLHGKKLRKGYTTGACAAAAAKAAVQMLVSGEPLGVVVIDTPAGVRLQLPVMDIQLTSDTVRCAVVKDGGDDPDVTTGLKIFAEVKLTTGSDIQITAGEGIGMVTLPGLKVAVGQPAINPVPRQMILKEVATVAPAGQGLYIILSVPGGAAVAERTFNPRLGIRGGISILGTTGIVNPMSEEAWKETIAVELGVLAAKGLKTLVFTFGNYGSNFAVTKLGIDSVYILKVSNFLGFMLEKAIEQNITNILLVGHIGKLVKVAAGIFHTHNRVADARRETLTAYAALEGAPRDIIQRLFSCTTTEAAVGIINAHNLTAIYQRIVTAVSQRCSEYTFHKIKLATLLFHGEETLLAGDKLAGELVTALGGRLITSERSL
jgi:cobalt-precorrin-5B (C1)-methyltransferase